MRQIDNYGQFCKAFGSDDNELKKEAKLLLFIQNWIIRILDYMEEDTLDYSLKKMVEQNADKMSNIHTLKDALSSIVNDSDLAFRHLNENMREKIIRENVQMPVYKVREINSYGLNWLSRQSGRTIRQKVSSAGNSIMAVQRRMSFDTAENRLFVAFAKEIQRIAKYNQISDADMEKGQMRVDVNISIRKEKTDPLGTRVELKNINSFSAIKRAIDAEVIRQLACRESGETIQQQTRRRDDLKGQSFAMRSKEDALDYRYFPEPDLPPLVLSDELLQKVETTELIIPFEQIKKMKSEF